MFEQAHHAGSGGDDFGEGGGVEDGIERHRFAIGKPGFESVGLTINDLIVATDEEHGAGNEMALDGFIDEGSTVCDGPSTGDLSTGVAAGTLRPRRRRGTKIGTN